MAGGRGRNLSLKIESRGFPHYNIVMLSFELLSKNNLAEALDVQRAIFPGEDAEINFLESIGAVPKDRDVHLHWLVRSDSGEAIGVVGLYSYYEYKGDAWLGWFGVLPRFRGQGLARRAFEFFEEEARKRGFKNVRLYTDEDSNHDAVGFYKHLGMTAEPYSRNPPYERTLIFSKSLAGGKAPAWNNKELYLDKQRAKELAHNICPPGQA